MTKEKPTATSALNRFFDSRKDQVFYLAGFLFLVLSLLSFDPKLSIGGDDASYIVRALRFVDQGVFPTFQGPLYPIFLSPFVAAFGIKVNLLKTLSLVLGLGFISLLYYTLRNRVDSFLLSLVMLFTCFNSYLIYYASQTYNEIFHLFIEVLFMYYFFKFLDKLGDAETNLKRDVKHWMLMAFLTLLIVLSKNIGMALVISVPLYFVLKRKFISAGVYVGFFGVLFLLYRTVRDLIWTSDSPFAKQGQVFLYKDPYNFSKGKEDLMGYAGRLYENTHLYLSKNLMKILHIRDIKVTNTVEIISYIVIILVIFALYRSYKKNKEVFFVSVFSVITLSVTFVILQVRWDSDRLVVLLIPFLILLLLYSIQEILLMVNKKFLMIAVNLILVLLLISNLSFSFKKVDILTTKKNLRGEKYHGYTEDWVNYLKMSEWVEQNLPENSLIAVRKQTMSIIFAGSLRYYSIAKMPSNDPDSLLDKLKNGGVTHVVMASLRRNPNQKSEYTINTVQRYLATIEVKYPGTFRQIHVIGTSEPARLFEIHYPR